MAGGMKSPLTECRGAVQFTRPAAAPLVLLPGAAEARVSFLPTLGALQIPPDAQVNYLPRLSSRHSPMKENVHATTPMAIPAKNGGE